MFPESSTLSGPFHTPAVAAVLAARGLPPPPPPPTSTGSETPTVSSSPQPGTGTFFSGGGGSPSLIVGLISIGALVVAVISTLAWSRYMGRTLVPEFILTWIDRLVPRRIRRSRRQGRERQDRDRDQDRWERPSPSRRWRHGYGHGHGRTGGRGGREGEGGRTVGAKPEMFEVWIGRGGRTVDDTLKWEVEAESVPFSATLFTTGPPGPGPVVTEVPSSRAGRDCVEEEDEEEKRCLRRREGHRAGSGHATLQVAVLLQMPSPSPSPASPSHTVTETRNDISVRGELAVGLIEIPWTREHTFSRHGDGSTSQSSI